MSQSPLSSCPQLAGSSRIAMTVLFHTGPQSGHRPSPNWPRPLSAVTKGLSHPSSCSAHPLPPSQLCSLPFDTRSAGPRRHCAHRASPAEHRGALSPRGVLATGLSHPAQPSTAGWLLCPSDLCACPSLECSPPFLFSNYTFYVEVIVDSHASYEK